MARWLTYARRASVATMISLGGCTFNTSTNADLSIIDGGPSIGTRPDAIAPEDCPADIHIVVSVDGVDAPPVANAPYVHTIIGDTVELSAIGTCTKSGEIQYQWSIEPSTGQVEGTALPDLASETIRVYSVRADMYTVTLEISDGSRTESLQFYGFDAHGFAQLDSYPGNKILDLSAGADFLWVGADNGGYRGSLATPTEPFVSVDTQYFGDQDDLPSKLHVHETNDGSQVWFGSEDADGTAYRLTLADEQTASFPTLGGAKTREIDDAETGIRIATDKGVAIAPDSQNFTEERNNDASALSFGATGSWAGKERLYRLPDGDEFDLFGGDDKLQALDDDGTLLWIGSDSDGVVTFANQQIQASYKDNNSNIPSNDVESISIDSSRDVWVGTSKGVGRFKRDRQVWVTIAGEGTGLSGTVDIDAIDVDEVGGRRAIYAGGPDGLFIMTAP